MTRGGEQAIKERGSRGGGGGFSSSWDLFNRFAGGMGRQSNKAKVVMHKLELTLEELYNGQVCCKKYVQISAVLLKT